MNVKTIPLVMIPREELTNVKAMRDKTLRYIKESQLKLPERNNQKSYYRKKIPGSLANFSPQFEELELASQIRTVKKAAKPMYR